MNNNFFKMHLFCFILTLFVTDMCFIDNTCYPDSQQNPDAECSICKSELSRTAWTQHDGIHFVYKLDFILCKKRFTDASGILKWSNRVYNNICSYFCIIDKNFE